MSTLDTKFIRPAFDCWAIRQISTGKYLPMRWKSARGYSHDEPSWEFPRLFKNLHSARCALTAWLQGEWKQECITHGEFGEEIEYVAYPTLVPGRNAGDFEIVEFRLERRRIGDGYDWVILRCDTQNCPLGEPPLLRCILPHGHGGTHLYELSGVRMAMGNVIETENTTESIADDIKRNRKLFLESPR